MNYVYAKQFYVDLYDIRTINECLRMINFCKGVYVKGKTDANFQKIGTPGDLAKSTNYISNQLIFQIVGRRYEGKAESIKKWMLEAQHKQDKFDQTNPPVDQHCPDCDSSMTPGLKEFYDFEDFRVMFLFTCDSCKKRLWIYEDGQIKPSTPTLCIKCSCEAVVSATKESKDKVTWQTKCKSCGHIETKIDDFKKSRDEREAEEKKDKLLLDTYCNEFCSDEKGQYALDYISALPVAKEVYNEEVKKYDNQAYQKITTLNKLSITDLEKLIKPVFDKQQFVNLVLGQPEIARHVIVSFTVQDVGNGRVQAEAITELKKSLRETLESTNWRLMSEGLNYRLGYVSGRLKGYEQEEDFLEISGFKPEEADTKVKSEARRKYEHSKVVQLAKMSGEFEGKENARKRRLKNKPGGFILGEEGIFSCGLCGENRRGKEMWWSLDGIHCLDCHHNILSKNIPSFRTLDKHEFCFFDWELKSQYGISPPTASKLRREGLLHPRNLKRADGSTYFSLYLYSENKEFLKLHPAVKQHHMKITDLLGEEVEI